MTLARNPKNNIKFWRQELKMSQWDLSHLTGIARWKMQLIECDHKEPTEDELKKISAVLKVKKELIK